MGVTVITATADRPIPFAFCERWMARQTFSGDMQWLVVDGGEEPIKCKLGQEHIKTFPALGADNLLNNLWTGLQHARYPKILFVEDDDWYDPTYIEIMDALLDKHDLVGSYPPIAFNVKYRRYFIFKCYGRTSLSRTGITVKHLNIFRRLLLKHSEHVDQALWPNILGGYIFKARICVSIKGLPGKLGYTPFHLRVSRWRADPKLRILRSWLGEDCEVYAPFYGGVNASSRVFQKLPNFSKAVRRYV